MIKKVIVLGGGSGQGKTTTLNKLAKHIATSLGIMPMPFGFPGSIHTDHQYYFDIAHHGGLVRVGISTHGDSSDWIKYGFDFFKKYNCEVCFIACKTYGDSVVGVEEQCKMINVEPSYLLLIRHIDSANRSQNRIQDKVVKDLYSLI